jgi:TolB-like protein
MAPGLSPIFEFGPFRLDTGQGVLLRDGQRIPLIPKAIDLFAVLLGNAGSVVSKDHLLERVWPDAFVQEGNLHKLVFLLRKELERAPGAGQIETVSKRGYVFTGSVRDVTPLAGTSPQPEARSIAVLPFAIVAGEAAAHLGESVAEEVLSALSRVSGLAVVARTSSFRLAAAGLDLPEIGRQLQVAWLVEGSARVDAAKVRVTASLVDVQTTFQRWSRTFERPLSELSTVPEEIAAAIAGAIDPSDAPHPRPVHATDPRAYDLYLQGRYFWNRRPGAATWRALECFEEAARRAPSFPQALAGIADVYSTLGSWEAGVLPHDEAQHKAREFAERALAIDPHLAEARTTLAYTALHYGWDAQAAETGFARALKENPAYAAAHHWRSHALIVQGRVDESLAASRAALSYDPMNLLLTAHFAWHYHMAR